MTASIRLIHEGSYLELNSTSGWYRVGDAFTPPTANYVPTFSTGTFGDDLAVDTPTNQNYTLPIHIKTTNATSARAAASKLQAFLQHAGKQAEPLYLGWREHGDYSIEPVLGEQDCFQRYEIVKGDLFLAESFYNSQISGRVPNCTLQLTIKPTKTIRPMRLGQAKGAVFMDNIATTDKRSKGVQVCPAITNLITNPIFGAGATTGWTAASLTATLVTDKRYVLFGRYSVKLEALAGAGGHYTQTITATAANHSLSFYVKRPDGGVITSGVVRVRFEGATVDAHTIEALENGWYRVQYSATPSAGASTYGPLVQDGYTVYMTGCQLHAQTDTYRFVPLIYGDRLGCAWSGTAHQSTSTSTVGYLRYATDDVNFSAFTIRIAVKLEHDAAQVGSGKYWVAGSGGAYQLYFTSSTDKIVWTDGTNTVASTAQTYNIGDTIIIHATAGKTNGLALYVEGAPDGTGTYTIPTKPSYLYLGSTATPNTHAADTILGFSIWPFEMTAAQVAADYARVSPLVDQTMRVDACPAFWNADGDWVIDYYNDSNQDNYGVALEVPGDVEGAGKMMLTYASGPASLPDLWLSRYATPEYLDPGYLYFDFNGTGTSSVHSGDGITTQSVSTSNVLFSSTLSRRTFEAIAKQTVKLLAKAVDNGSNLLLSWKMDYGSKSITTETIAAASLGAGSAFILQAVPTLGEDIFLNNQTAELTVTVSLIAVRTTGTANVDLDFFQILPNALWFGLTSHTVYALDENEANELDSSNVLYKKTTVNGRPLRFAPHAYNPVTFNTARHNLLYQSINLTLSKLFVEPRWKLL